MIQVYENTGKKPKLLKTKLLVFSLIFPSQQNIHNIRNFILKKVIKINNGGENWLD